MNIEPDILEQLSAYADDALPASERAALETRLAGDEALRAELTRLRQVRGLLQALPRATAPAGLAQAVLARVERGQLLNNSGHAAVHTRRWWFARLASAAAVVLAVGGVGLLVHRFTTTSYIDDRGRSQAQAPKDQPGHVGPEIAISDKLPGKSPESLVGDLGANNRAAVPPVSDAGVVFINTDDLTKTQREVARLLLDNGVEPSKLNDKGANPALAQQRREAMVAYQDKVNEALKNSVFGQEAQEGQVIFPVVADQKQISKVVAELNKLREQQNVPQVPTVTAELDGNIRVTAPLGPGEET